MNYSTFANRHPRLRDAFLAEDVYPEEALRMFLGGQHARDDASIQSAAERGNFGRVAAITPHAESQHAFAAGSEAIMLRSLKDGTCNSL